MKIPFKKYLYLIALLTAPTLVTAQFYNTGQAPASVIWMQIKTDNFQIIYPSGFYNEANRAANLLEHMYKYGSEDYSKKPKKISVILYNQSVRSNGYVVWAPKRSEWVTTPLQDTYVQDWLEQLALHEYRHVVQISNLEQGFTKILKIVFGEMATGAVTGYLPLWFLEGDAVMNETALSSTGRGRAPDFTFELRAIELEKEKRYSYDQSYLGSYKYFVPNYYKYGYQMVSYAKLKYDNTIWGKTIDKVGRRPYLGAPFYFGLKKNGAKSKVNLYNETFDSLRLLWKTETANLTLTVPEHFNIPKTKHYTSYNYVQSTPYGAFAVKTTIDDLTRFVFLKDSTVEIIHTPGRYSNTPVSAGKKYVVWEEYLPDARWQQRNYSVIKLLELATGNEKQLTQKSRYFTPSLSPSDDKIACIRIDEQNQYSIIILDSFNGETLDEIVIPPGMQVFHPVWLNEETLVFISMTDNSKQIEKLSINSRKREVLFRSGLNNISYLHARNSIIYFSFDLEMSRNIYALDLSSNRVFKITSSNYGADYPFVQDNHVMYYSDYTLNGYVPAKIDLSSSKWEDISKIEKYKYVWADSLSLQAGTNIQKDAYPAIEYDSLNYNRYINSFYLHSWTPFYLNIEDFFSMNPEIIPGFTLLSQNKLSTVTSSLSYYYKNQNHHLEPKITIEGLYPVFEISALFTNQPGFLNQDEDIQPPDELLNYSTFSLRCYLPLNLTRNKYKRYLQPGIRYSYSNAYYYSNSIYKLGYNYLDISVYLSNLLKRSSRDLYSRFGQSLYLEISQSLKDAESFTPTQLGVFNLYLPGFFRHHSTRIYLAGETKDIKQFTPNNGISLPRGYSSRQIYLNLIRGNIEYTFPVFYPDWSIGPFAYIKRFHASFFYDAAKVKYLQNENSTALISTGITLASEMHFIRFFVPFTPKLTIAYLPHDKDIEISFGMSINASFF